MRIFLRYALFCALLLALVTLVKNYTSNTDYALIEKEVTEGDSLALRDLEDFRQAHGEDRKALLFYHIMRTRLLTQEGEEVSLDSPKAWVAEAKQTGDSLLYAKALETLSACYAQRDELQQALAAQQRAYGIMCKENVATALQMRHSIALFAVILCCVAAFCLTFLHLYLRCRTEKRHAERRLTLAREQLSTATHNADHFLHSLQHMKQAVEAEHTSTASDALADINRKMTNEMRAFQMQQISLAITEIASSDIVERMKHSVTDRRINISEKDWSALTEEFAQRLPQLITLLQVNGAVTTNERRICLLTLLDIGTLEMASLLSLLSSSVSSAKKSLLTKLTNNDSASAKELKTKIISLLVTA